MIRWITSHKKGLWRGSSYSKYCLKELHKQLEVIPRVFTFQFGLNSIQIYRSYSNKTKSHNRIQNQIHAEQFKMLVTVKGYTCIEAPPVESGHWLCSWDSLLSVVVLSVLSITDQLSSSSFYRNISRLCESTN